MSDQTVYLVLRDLSPISTNPDGHRETVPVSAFADRIEAECEMQRLGDGDDRRANRRKGIVRDYRIEEVTLHG